jgi:hypothetical protein
VADLFTKGLSSAQFLLLKSKLLVVPTPINLGGMGGVKGYQALKRLSTGPVHSSTVTESNEFYDRV